MDSQTARVRVSWAAKRFRQMHANIFFTVLVPNIENGKLLRQVGSVDTGLKRVSQKVPHFFSQWYKPYNFKIDSCIKNNSVDCYNLQLNWICNLSIAYRYVDSIYEYMHEPPFWLK